jgi:hypothetical protein
MNMDEMEQPPVLEGEEKADGEEKSSSFCTHILAYIGIY